MWGMTLNAICLEKCSGSVESPTKNLLSKQQINPVAKIWKVPDQKNELAPVGSPDYPYVITTYRLTEHHLSGVMSRYLPMLAELHHSHFAEISHELAKELGIENGEKTFPVSEITISLNFDELWKSIDAVGDDLDPKTRFATPTFRVAKMTIAGT